jgi:4'-phosphopantetheinyl transferase
MSPLEIQVWGIALDTLPTRDETLSQDERDRAARFHFERDQIRFINAHAALREILSRETNTPPRMLEFHMNEYGKPALANDAGVQFNLSHSQDKGLLAVARGIKLGVDIEALRANFDVVELAARFFAPREVERVKNEPARFFEIWTRKEAFIKAIGMGVSFPLQEFDVCEERVKVYPSAKQYTLEEWFVQSFEPTMGYIAAVATNAAEFQLQERVWS